MVNFFDRFDAAQATNRGFNTADVGAAVRGDLFNEPNLPIHYAAKPGQTFGQQATANAQPFQNIVAHHTGSSTLGSALNTAQKGDPFRAGVNYGYHFYIDTDGSITQGAPLDARTNHVKPAMMPQRSGRPDIDNSNSIGVSFVGTGGPPNQAQLSAAENLSRSLMTRYGIDSNNVVGHGEIQRDRQTGEGMALVNQIRNGGQPVRVAQAPVASDAAPEQPQVQSSSQQAAPFVPQRPDSVSDNPAETGKPAGNFFNQFDAKPTKDIGRGKAVLEGLRAGATANFGDELAGANAASGLPSWVPDVIPTPAGPIPLKVIMGGAKAISEYVTGKPGDATAAYEKRRDEVRADQKAAQDQYPGTYIAGNIAGAVAMPGGAALQAATVPARMARSAAVGAGYGGLSGVGEGEDLQDRAVKGAVGVGAGGLVGAAAVPVIAGAQAVGRGVATAARPFTDRIVRPFTDRIVGAFDPERVAAQNVTRAITRDIKAGSNELTAREWNAARQAGVPVSVAELGGETTRATARSAANLSPEGRNALADLAEQRFAGQTNRVVTYLKNIFGIAGDVDTAAVRDGLKSQARAVNNPAYTKLFNDPRSHGLWDEVPGGVFEQISQAPVVQNAIRAASVTAANRGTVDGLPRIPSPFTIDRATGQLTLRVDENGNRVLPNLQFWDAVKRNLDKIGTPEARALNGALKSHLDDLVPDYKTVRAGAARFFDAEDAADAGHKFAGRDFSMPEARRAFAAMSNEEKDLFRYHFAARLINDISNTSDRVNIANKIANTKAAKEKIEMVLGPRGANTLQSMMSVESSIDRLRTALGNSTTVRQMVELGLAGSSATYGLTTGDPNQIAVIAAIGGRRWVDQRIAKHVARMLTSDDPTVLAKGIKVVQNNGPLSNAFRSMDGALARVGVQQSPVVQIPAAVSADDKKPNVERPPGQ